MPEDVRRDDKRIELFETIYDDYETDFGSHFFCPKCDAMIPASYYLGKAISSKKACWIANMVTHWRHQHTDWDANKFRLNGRKGIYENDKKKVNEYIKQLLIKKFTTFLIEHNITAEHFKQLQNSDKVTVQLAESKLT